MKKELDKATRLYAVRLDIHYARVNLRAMRRHVKKYGHCIYKNEDFIYQKKYIKRLKKELTTIRRKYKNNKKGVNA